MSGGTGAGRTGVCGGARAGRIRVGWDVRAGEESSVNGGGRGGKVRTRLEKPEQLLVVAA